MSMKVRYQRNRGNLRRKNMGLLKIIADFFFQLKEMNNGQDKKDIKERRKLATQSR